MVQDRRGIEESPLTAFREFLRRRSEGEALDIDTFCSERAGIADGIRLLYSDFLRTRAFGSSADSATLTFADPAFLSAPTPVKRTAPEAKEEETAPAFVEYHGRLVLGGEVARGGMGVIYQARDVGLSRTVAMKLMTRSSPRAFGKSADSGALARFLEEAQVTAQLDHPGIVPVHDTGFDAEGRAFFTMRLVQGQDLGAIFRLARAGKESWNLPRALGVLVKTCQAIAYAHSKGVIHRDLKPSNVMVGHFGEVYVMDWGLVKVTGKKDLHDIRIKPAPDRSPEAPDAAPDAPPDDASPGEPRSPLETMDGTVVGTPAYMSPEQAEGHVEEVDQASDVYSLGAILYTLLTGRVPYLEDGTTTSPRAILRRVRSGPPRRVQEVDPTVPPELVAICEKAMARNRTKRYPTSAELAEDLQAYIDQRVVQAYRTGALAEFRSWLRRNRGTALSLAVAVLSLALGLLGSVWFGVEAHVTAEREKDARVATETMREQSLRVAAKFAARTVAGEIDVRWRLLEAEATSARLQRWVRELGGLANVSEEGVQRELVGWVRDRYLEHELTTRATSWFVTDHAGRHLARWPEDSKAVGKSFAFRDYFHGHGRDLGEAAALVHPIDDVHRSVVFQSTTTDTLMVAFSVPIRDRGGTVADGEGEVVGVLAMTVELGQFGILQLDLDTEQLVVLVETESDWVEGEERRGLLLHHPHLSASAERQTAPRDDDVDDDAATSPHADGAGPVFRLDADRLARLQRLRLDAPDTAALDHAYDDPVGARVPGYAGPWLAAFEPIRVRGRPAPIADTGWVVVVQERRAPVASGAQTP